MISCCRGKCAHPTSVVGSILTWIDHETDSAIEDEHRDVPDSEYPMDQTCKPLDYLLCRIPSVKWKSSPHLPFQ